ncbi:MAG: hypothetical protein RXR51_04185 [Nitrososphaeria archaeon]
MNKGLEIEGRKKVSDTTCYNVLARNVEAERRLQKEYGTFEWNDPDSSRHNILQRCAVDDHGGWPFKKWMGN